MNLWRALCLASIASAGVLAYVVSKKKVDSDVRVAYVTDIEGNYLYLLRYVKISTLVSIDDPSLDAAGGLDAFSPEQLALRYSKGVSLKLADDRTYFVFGGDCFDKGVGDIRVAKALIDLKERYPHRVFLLIGNRDANKVRLTQELHPDDLKRPLEQIPGLYFIAEECRSSPLRFVQQQIMSTRKDLHSKYKELAGKISEAAKQQHPDTASADCSPSKTALRLNHLFSAEQLAQSNTRAARCRYILQETMGTEYGFEQRRKELAILHDTTPKKISDEAVAASFYDEAFNENGVVRQYLLHAQMGVTLGNTLFLHAGLDECSAGFTPLPVHLSHQSGAYISVSDFASQPRQFWQKHASAYPPFSYEEQKQQHQQEQKELDSPFVRFPNSPLVPDVRPAITFFQQSLSSIRAGSECTKPSASIHSPSSSSSSSSSSPPSVSISGMISSKNGGQYIGVHEWIHRLNIFYESELSNWMLQPNYSLGREVFGGHRLFGYSTSVATNKQGILYICPIHDGNFKPVSGVVPLWLGREHIHRLVLGHIPVGNCPAPYRMIDGFEMLLADTSYSEGTVGPNSDPRGIAVSEVVLRGPSLQCLQYVDVHGLLQDGRTIQYRLALHSSSSSFSAAASSFPSSSSAPSSSSSSFSLVRLTRCSCGELVPENMMDAVVRETSDAYQCACCSQPVEHSRSCSVFVPSVVPSSSSSTSSSSWLACLFASSVKKLFAFVATPLSALFSSSSSSSRNGFVDFDSITPDPFIGRLLQDGWWVKAKLTPRSTVSHKPYLIAHGKGYTVKYREVNAAELCAIGFAWMWMFSGEFDWGATHKSYHLAKREDRPVSLLYTVCRIPPELK